MRNEPLLERLSSRDNALNTIRLALASAVILSHHYVTSGSGHVPSPGGYSWGGWAVMGFFAISGYLVTGSRLVTSLPTYLLRRGGRIYPAFVVCLVVTAAVLAPLAARLERTAVDPADAWHYVRDNITLWMFKGGIEDTLSTSPFPHVWNASAWTLAYEALGYLAIAVLVTGASVVRHRRVMWGVLAVLTMANLLVTLRGSGNNVITLSCWLGAFMVAGACVRLHADRVRPHVFAMAGATAVIVAAGSTGFTRVLAPLPVAYLLLCLGAVLPTTIGSVNDLSYGLYIYAFPVQQVLAVSSVNRFGVIGLALTFVFTGMLALLSWVLVERPSIAWVRRRGRRPARKVGVA